jgi:uracil-DNA glycosylase family 4
VRELTDIIDETIKAVEELKRSGVTHIDVSRETLEELGKPPRPPTIAATGQFSCKTGRMSPSNSRLSKHAPRRVQSAKNFPAADTASCSASAIRAPNSCLLGEAPGADEDEQGEPFVGRAGQLLTKIILAMGYQREDVYISNIIKCRPPENRTPLPDEVTNCLPYVLAQIELIKPKVIVALGATALRSLLDIQLGITKMRGHWYTFRDIPIMPTFHPAYLLRNPPAKREVWDDMKSVLEKLGRKVPTASSR